MLISVKLQNLDAASLRVKYLQRAAQGGLKDGVEAAAALVFTEAVTLVPVDTGHLRDSIHIESVLEESETQARKVTPVVDAENKYGLDPAYARRIEYGFVGADSLGRVYHQAARPYMRPAADSKRSEAIALIKSEIYDALAGARR